MKITNSNLPSPIVKNKRAAITITAVVMAACCLLSGCGNKKQSDELTPETGQTIIVTTAPEEIALPSPTAGEALSIATAAPEETPIEVVADTVTGDVLEADPNASPSPSPSPQGHVHDYEKKVVKATCLDEGYTINTCECGVTFRDSFVDPLGHDFDKDVHAASCSERGYTMYECVRCKGAYVEDYTDMIPHNYAVKTVAATCTENGYEEHVCIICGDFYRDKEVKSFGHDYETSTIAATCTQNGKSVKTCKTCGYSTSTNLEKSDHTWDNGKINKAPGCETTGSVLYTCVNCSATKSSTLAATGHEMQTDVIKATCSHQGYTAHTCIYCGYFYEENFTDMVDHRYSPYKVLSEPTCTAAGSKIMKCNVCQHETTTTTDALGHSYKVTSVVSPTETEQGYSVYTCSGCGDNYKGDYVDAIGPSA